MFVDNKYTKWYFSLIYYAKSQNRQKGQCYVETHHIIPKSLNGDNSMSNKVNLTPREHFICHLLLTKMVSGADRHKMLHAFMLMKGSNNFQNRYVNSKLYEYIKLEYGLYRSSVMKGIPMTTECKAKISATMKEKNFKMSDDTKNKISAAAKLRVRTPFSEEYKLKMSSIMKRIRNT